MGHSVGVEFSLEALEGRVSDNIHPNLIPQSVAGLLARENIVLIALLENEFANSNVSPPSHSATSTVEVKLGPEHLGTGTVNTSLHAIEPIRISVKRTVWDVQKANLN